jgi:hypothetical protein
LIPSRQEFSHPVSHLPDNPQESPGFFPVFRPQSFCLPRTLSSLPQVQRPTSSQTTNSNQPSKDRAWRPSFKAELEGGLSSTLIENPAVENPAEPKTASLYLEAGSLLWRYFETSGLKQSAMKQVF